MRSNIRAVPLFFLVVSLLTLAACSDQPATDSSAENNADAAGEVSGDIEAVANTVPAEVEEAGLDAATVKPELTEGEAYLHINSKKPGVKVLESGLQFEILEQGTGKSPGLTSNVVTHYHGTFVTGNVFDSSVERGSPAEFPVNRVIKGWTEALQMMKEGDVWRLVIPPELAYGERGAGNTIPPNSVLVFEVELIEVKD